MKPNKECMKDILLFIEANTKFKVDDMSFHNINMKSSSLAELIDKMPKETNYSAEEIAYNAYMCYRYHLFEADFKFNGSTIQSTLSDIYGLSFEGIDFIGQN